ETPNPAEGVKDEREMSADIFTTSPGAAAAGSEGASEAARGVGDLEEPNPVPTPADPLPETLDYVTVYDNHNTRGFPGGQPAAKPENFRCAYATDHQGRPRNVSSRG